jgi:Cu+-exporting ATPase
VLAVAAAIERRSEHPLAEGIVRAAMGQGAPLDGPDGFEVYPGEGVVGTVGGERVWCGTEKLLARAGVVLTAVVHERVAMLATDGKSVALVATQGGLVGLIALADTLRPEVLPALAALRTMGVQRLLLLTGDRRQVAEAMARRLGVEFEAEVLPADKIRTIADLQRTGHVVAMVGDGINDAPALAQADVGIAMGAAGTDAAIEAAHVALMRDNWLVVPEAIAIGRRAFRTIKQNLWFTAAYNVVGIVLAVTGWLSPVAAAAAQSLPDVAVMLNASRLLRDRSTRLHSRERS